MRNLRIGVIKLVRKVSINLLHHPKSAVCVISIIINSPAVAYSMVSTQLNCQSCIPKQIDLTSLFVTTAALLRLN